MKLERLLIVWLQFLSVRTKVWSIHHHSLSRLVTLTRSQFSCSHIFIALAKFQYGWLLVLLPEFSSISISSYICKFYSQWVPLITVQVLCSILEMEAFSNKEHPWERKLLANLGKLLKNAHVLVLDHGVGGMGINKDQPNEDKGYLFWASCSKGVSHQHVCWAVSHRQA